MTLDDWQDRRKKIEENQYAKDENHYYEYDRCELKVYELTFSSGLRKKATGYDVIDALCGYGDIAERHVIKIEMLGYLKQ